MPIYEYECTFCGTKHEKISMMNETKISCDICGAVAEKVPSVPGYRRDHTTKYVDLGT